MTERSNLPEPSPETVALSRRSFLQSGALAGAGLLLPETEARAQTPGAPPIDASEIAARLATEASGSTPRTLDLSPAKWIWYPSRRTLQNTFVLFRREFTLASAPRVARGWILGESRYQLRVNGVRVQFGPAPSDPRWPEVDPVDLSQHLRAGVNTIAVTVLYYGQGDGTWPAGKPGFLFKLEGVGANPIVSDASWKAHLARSWPPGQYKRWYLRALQEEFDARLYPYGWDHPGYQATSDWLPAMEIRGGADRPAVAHAYDDYLFGSGVLDASAMHLRPRSIPLLGEDELRPVVKLTEAYSVRWSRPAEEYFEVLAPDAFTAIPIAPPPALTGAGEWRVPLDTTSATALTFELAEQIVGWPYFTIVAPSGTTVELMVHEAHEVGGPPLLNSHFNAWTRFICKEGENRFETFDFECLRWMQLHIRGATGPVIVRDVGVRRRVFPMAHPLDVRTSDASIDSVVRAAANTVYNSAQDILADGMGRERQQYSGDVGHELHALYHGWGETRLPARYVTTFSQGMTLDGYFLDTWPSYDRLNRIPQRQLGLTPWGPLLDHGVGFTFDCWHHYLYTGRREDVTEAYPRLVRFFEYLRGIRLSDGLLPVEGLGVPVVWMDNSYAHQRHKQCAFNLYAAGMAARALAPLSRAFGEATVAHAAEQFAADVLRATVEGFWSSADRLFIINRPWMAEERTKRTCDRSLAMAILFDQLPAGGVESALSALTRPPEGMMRSYPANAGWPMWALAKGGQIQVVLDDLRLRWARLPSVQLNRTIQEHWEVKPDSGAQWSHCPVAPLYIMYMGVAGITPEAPGFARYSMRPQLGDLSYLRLTSYTVRGPLEFEARGRRGSRTITIRTPPGTDGGLELDAREVVALPSASREGTRIRYRLPAGAETKLSLQYT